ncbi:hypothetical protein GQ54DRAFT_77178 [Martensiomyces pterosporus]|nr:hypothetical protein GQ54DRAFT_77178 [Martensiomyces pterosporus]
MGVCGRPSNGRLAAVLVSGKEALSCKHARAANSALRQQRLLLKLASIKCASLSPQPQQGSMASCSFPPLFIIRKSQRIFPASFLRRVSQAQLPTIVCLLQRGKNASLSLLIVSGASLLSTAIWQLVSLDALSTEASVLLPQSAGHCSLTARSFFPRSCWRWMPFLLLAQLLLCLLTASVASAAFFLFVTLQSALEHRISVTAISAFCITLKLHSSPNLFRHSG